MVELTDMNIFIYHASKSITREGKEMDFVSVFAGALNVLFSPYFLPYLSLQSIIDALFSAASLS